MKKEQCCYAVPFWKTGTQVLACQLDDGRKTFQMFLAVSRLNAEAPQTHAWSTVPVPNTNTFLLFYTVPKFGQNQELIPKHGRS